MITRAPALERTIIDGVLVLRPVGTDVPVALRGSAAAIWHALSRPTSLDALLTSLAASYGVAASDLRSDVVAALDDLDRRGLITR